LNSLQKAAKVPKDMTKHHLLVLLLRLRQACSHPALIKTMLDTTETESIGSDAKIDESDDLDLISQLASMNIDGNKNEQKEEEETNFFTLSNPVFKTTNTSSKMKNVIDEVQRVISKGQKVVIVSQWTSMLDVFDTHFQHLNIRCHRIAGNVNVKQRTAFVEDFNTNPKGPPVKSTLLLH
jgi:transcription termination factor 2